MLSSLHSVFAKPAVIQTVLKIGATVLALASATAGYTRSVVIKASGPSAAKLSPGTVLNDPINLDLRDGDQVTLWDAQGTRLLKGPIKIRGQANQSAPDSNTLQTFRQIFANAFVRRAAIAASRTTDNGPIKSSSDGSSTDVFSTTDNLWFIDTAADGNWCVTNPDAVEIWRANTASGTDLTVTSTEGPQVTSRWRKGLATLPWPSSAGVKDRGQYILRLASDPERLITLHVLNFRDADTPLQLIKALDDKGCDNQLRLLEEMLK